MSGSGTPLGPIFQGVWQSLQDMIVTRYFPRSTRRLAGDAAGLEPASAPDKSAMGARRRAMSAAAQRDVFERIRSPRILGFGEILPEGRSARIS
jgi:hypothetical protein